MGGAEDRTSGVAGLDEYVRVQRLGAATAGRGGLLCTGRAVCAVRTRGA